MSTIQHIVAPGELMAYLDGELPAERAETIRAHLATCRACRDVFAELQHVSDEMRGWEVDSAPETVKAPVMPADRPRRFRRAFAFWPASLRQAAAAALCIVAAGGVMWLARLQPRLAVSAPQPSPPAGETLPIVLGGRGGSTSAIDSVRSDELRVRVRQLEEEYRRRLAYAPGAPAAAPAASQIASAQPRVGGATDLPPQALASTQVEAAAPMIARTASLTIVTKEMAAVRPAIDAMLRDLGGFVGTIQVSGEGNIGSLHATLRVPVQRLDAAITALRALGRVTDEAQTGEDVGDQVRDLDARLTNSRNTEKRLTEVLRTRTGDVSDVLQVEREIARVREEIERMDAERTHLERRVAYATIALRVERERQATLDMGPQPLSSRLRNAAVDGLRHAFESIVDVALSLLHTAPFVLLWVLVLWWPVRVAIRRGRAWLRPAA